MPLLHRDRDFDLIAGVEPKLMLVVVRQLARAAPRHYLCFVGVRGMMSGSQQKMSLHTGL
jgi:hypothetical protein